ncbi:hypothetical protein V5F53_00280 [Xanthobacter sp. V4C-4]|uniref:hypothetical protein n=1 Tax=Xanthobacter cornucopiae TaxID=3119924 RepID=UPI00372C630B
MADIHGVPCKGLKLTAPRVTCDDEAWRCLRFVKVSIEPHTAPDIAAAKAETP